MRLEEIAATGAFAYQGDKQNLGYALADSGVKSVGQLLQQSKDKVTVPNNPELQVMTFRNGNVVLLAVVDVVDKEVVGIFKLKDRRDIAPNHYQVDLIGVLPEYREKGIGKYLYDRVLIENNWVLISGDMHTDDGRRAWFKMASLPHIGVYGLLAIEHIAPSNSPEEIVEYYKRTNGRDKAEFNQLLKKYEAGIYGPNTNYIVFMVHPVIGKVHTPHFSVYDREGWTLLIAKHVG